MVEKDSKRKQKNLFKFFVLCVLFKMLLGCNIFSYKVPNKLNLIYI